MNVQYKTMLHVCQPQGEKEKTPVGPEFLVVPQNIHSVGPVE